MPFWLMFIPVVAIVQGIIILFVAFGQWVTGTYYTLEPIDGGRGGHIEIFRDVSPDGSMRIEARLDDGRIFRTSVEADSRRAIVRGLPSRRARDGVVAAVAVELVARDGNTLTCSFTRTNDTNSGGCVTPEGRHFDLVARDDRPDSTATPRG